MIFHKDHVREPLYCVVPYFNPWRWKSRAKHTERALKHFHDSGAVIILVEVAFNRREFVWQDCGLNGTLANCGVVGSDSRFTHKWIGLRSTSELWLKENAINIGVQSLPADWQQVAWLDSDIHFCRPNWVGEVIHKLQHYAFVQPFSEARDLAPNYELLPMEYPHACGVGWVKAWQDGHLHTTVTPEIRADLDAIDKDIKSLNQNWNKLKVDLCHYEATVGEKRVFPGLAWASTRQAWDATGGLLDTAIWGGGDWHMSHALIEKTESMMRNDLHKNYKKVVNQWYQRCRTHIRRNVGQVEGTVLHHWHGKKSQRGYNAKHSMLAQFGFDPPRHLKRDYQGLWQLHDDRSTSFVQIRDMMRRVATERNEDSIDV